MCIRDRDYIRNEGGTREVSICCLGASLGSTCIYPPTICSRLGNFSTLECCVCNPRYGVTINGKAKAIFFRGPCCPTTDQEIYATLSTGILCDFYDSNLAKLPISFPSGPVAEICEDGHLSPHSIFSLIKNYAIRGIHYSISNLFSPVSR